MISVHGAQSAQTIGLGTASKNLQLDDNEMGQIQCDAGLTIGSSSTGTISVASVTDGNTNSFGTLTLIASTPPAKVSFETAASTFNKGIVVLGNGGVDILADVTFKASATYLKSAGGTFAVDGSATLTSLNQNLIITAFDLNLQ